MIQTGNTIVYQREDGSLGFFWLCDVLSDGYLFFSWLGEPRRATASDYWRISRGWFNDRVADGTIEVFDSLPLDKYGDAFEEQALERNNR